MHETAIATNLVEQLLRIAREHEATRVVEVEVHCGVMQQVVPEALELAFEAASAGTPAAGVALKVVEIAAVARCRACGSDYEAKIDDFACPKCKTADADLIRGRDIVLQSVVCETEEKAAT